MSTIDLSGLQTEGRNQRTIDIDKRSALEICTIINQEDKTVFDAVQKCLPVIAEAIDSLVDRVPHGGRIISVGAGTSGRLGVLDASELPPTFSADPDQFIALIAGGDNALRHAQEGAEDDMDAAVKDLARLNLNGERDSLIGIAASGRTPYVLSALRYAKSLGCNTIGIACSYPSAMSNCGNVDHMINAITGPEVVTGSTRLKAGTATKLVLNMLSTASMIKTGKTYGNIMVDLKATNFKLQQRARNILRMTSKQAVSMSDGDLDDVMAACNGSVKLALVKVQLAISVEEARRRLESVNGVLSNIQSLMMPNLSNQEAATSRSDFVLCVDGGGSKCAAVIGDSSENFWRGESGSCNITSIGVENAVMEIKLAVEAAMASCPQLKGKGVQAARFTRIWVALAGYDRVGLSEPLGTAISHLFGRRIDDGLLVSTDVELLANIGGHKGNADTVIAAIAGTGSVAMRFKKQKNRFVRVARAGGWGSLLGDDGSGFDIGRRALRYAMAEIDQGSVSGVDGFMNDISPLTRLVIRHFTPEGDTGRIPDLLTWTLSQNLAQSQSEQDTKRRIAGLAPVVIAATSHDLQAKSILETAIGELGQLIQPFMRTRESKESSVVLVLAGGLMKSAVFRDMLQGSIAGTPFTCTIIVEDPAQAGAEYLGSSRSSS